MKELETERLRLRYINENDAENIFYGWANDPEVTKYLTWYNHESVDQTNMILALWLPLYEDSDTYRWGIERKEDGALMGMIDVVEYIDGNPVIGYCSGKKYWGNGYMTEACKAVINVLFNDGYSSIFIEAVDKNIGSNRVIEKCGFKFIGKKEGKLSEWKPDQIVTVNQYRIDK